MTEALWMQRFWRHACLVLALAAGLSACARPAPAPVVAPGMERFPEYPRPDLTPDLLQNRRAAEGHDRGWRFLQSGDLRSAERAFRDVLRRTPSFYPTETALGFTRLAQGVDAEALQAFDSALRRQTTYLPALIGRAEALLELDREADAFDTYQRVLAVAPDQPVALRRVEVLGFRAVQREVAAGRAARSAGDFAAAREAFTRAAQASPDSAFLYRDLADIARALDEPAEAVRLLDQAIALDDRDGAAFAMRGDLRERLGDVEGAVADYRRALNLDTGLEEVRGRLSRIEAVRAEAALPEEFKTIREATRLTRGDLAALLAMRVPTLLDAGRPAVVITDARRHWAQAWILDVVRSGAMDVFPNHTFQPGGVVTRGDLATTVSRLLLALAARAPAAAQAWQQTRLTFDDVRPGNALYPSISRSVAAGVLEPVAGSSFGMRRTVTGAEGVEAVERLVALIERAGLNPAADSDRPVQRP